nr:MAG TPA: hypothetical protein [Caudoviricetes sp.]
MKNVRTQRIGCITQFTGEAAQEDRLEARISARDAGKIILSLAGSRSTAQHVRKVLLQKQSENSDVPQ